MGCAYGRTMQARSVAVMFLVTGLFWCGRADACGSTPPAYWTLSGALPSDTQRPIPTDGAVVLSAKPWTDIYPDRGGAELLSQIDVTVRDASGAVVEGLVDAWYGTGAAVSWRPRGPMAPNSFFTLQAVANSTALRPAGAIGETTLAIAFATGNPSAPPLRLQGNLQARLETYDLALWKDCNNCGSGCTPNGSVRSLRARVTIPAVEGGYTPEGYAAWLWVTNDQPHQLPDGRGGTLVNLGGIKSVETGGTTDVLVAVPSEDEPYAPCFALRVFDPAGHFVDAPPLCLARQDINTTIRNLDGTTTAPAVHSDDRGCAIVGHDSNVGSGTLLGGLASCAAALAVGRWRRRSEGRQA